MIEATEGIDAFALAAEEYCKWAEASPADAVTEAIRARRLLLELLRRAIDLPDVFAEHEAVVISGEDYKRVYQRFGVLPFNYYSECFDPLIVPESGR